MSEPPPDAWWIPGRPGRTTLEPDSQSTVQIVRTPAGPPPAPTPVTVPVPHPAPVPSAGWGERPRRPRATALLVSLVAAVALAGVGTVALNALRSGPRTAAGAATAAGRAGGPIAAVDPAEVTVRASSTQRAQSGVDYGAANTLDGDPSTAWNSDGTRNPDGRGVQLTYTFRHPVDLAGISILNGYQKLRPRPGGRPALDLYAANQRLHRVRVITDSGRWTWDLADSRARQNLTMAPGSTRTVRFEIVSVYSSSLYPDLAISEVSFRAARR